MLALLALTTYNNRQTKPGKYYITLLYIIDKITLYTIYTLFRLPEVFH